MICHKTATSLKGRKSDFKQAVFYLKNDCMSHSADARKIELINTEWTLDFNDRFHLLMGAYKNNIHKTFSILFFFYITTILKEQF